MKKISLLLTLFVFSYSTYSQTAEEVANSYINAIGGKAKLQAIKTLKMTGKASTSGMEFPIIILFKGQNKFKSYISYQGMDIVQPGATDGKEVWSTNFMTMQNELMEEDAAEALKRETKDFPDAFLTYAQNGYSLELGEDEEVNGRACFALSLVKPDQTVAGQLIEGITKFLIDKETNLILLKIQKNVMGEIKTYTNDYRIINGFKFPFVIKTVVGGNTVSEVEMQSYETNVPIDDKVFVFPE